MDNDGEKAKRIIRSIIDETNGSVLEVIALLSKVYYTSIASIVMTAKEEVSRENKITLFDECIKDMRERYIQAIDRYGDLRGMHDV